MKKWVVVIGVMLLVGAAACAGSQDDLLKGLRPHPRLYADDADIARLWSLVASDAATRQCHDALRAEAESVGRPVTINRVGAMFTMFFCEGPVRSFAAAKASMALPPTQTRLM